MSNRVLHEKLWNLQDVPTTPMKLDALYQFPQQQINRLCAQYEKQGIFQYINNILINHIYTKHEIGCIEINTLKMCEECALCKVPSINTFYTILKNVYIDFAIQFRNFTSKDGISITIFQFREKKETKEPISSTN